MASMAAANLLGALAGRRITNEQLALQMEQMALTDPELAEHYARLAAAVPALQAQRAVEDAACAAGVRGKTATPRRHVLHGHDMPTPRCAW